jgi:hypothetical protein
MTPAEYEILVEELVKELSLSFRDMVGGISGSGRSNKIAGASGYKHQIDVCFTAMPWLVLVECKRWGTRVGVPEVLVLASRLADIKPTLPGQQIWVSLVSQKGASANAEKLARHFDIHIDVAQSAKDYSMRLRSQVNVCSQDGLPISDSYRVEVLRASKSDP